ncbi:MAG: SMC-Scp complex subunit ScpB [Bdellovibrionota bacterium]
MQQLTESNDNSSFNELKLKVEAVLFVADSPLEAGEIRALVGEVSLSDVRLAMRALVREYENRAFELFENANKYQIKTREKYIDLVRKQYAGKPRSLSKNALETLSVIAYKQPITKAQINALRQLDSSSIIQTLKDKELIYVSGTRKEVGNPLEYKTTEKFLEVFGLKKLADLPSLRSLQLNLDEQKQVTEALKSIEPTSLSGSVVEALPTAEDVGYLE